MASPVTVQLGNAAEVAKDLDLIRDAAARATELNNIIMGLNGGGRVAIEHGSDRFLLAGASGSKILPYLIQQRDMHIASIKGVYAMDRASEELS